MHEGINHSVNSLTNCIQLAVISETQKPKHKGHEKSSPKKGNLASMSSLQSSNVKMSSFDILKNLKMCTTIVVSNQIKRKLATINRPSV